MSHKITGVICFALACLMGAMALFMGPLGIGFAFLALVLAIFALMSFRPR